LWGKTGQITELGIVGDYGFTMIEGMKKLDVKGIYQE